MRRGPGNFGLAAWASSHKHARPVLYCRPTGPAFPKIVLVYSRGLGRNVAPLAAGYQAAFSHFQLPYTASYTTAKKRGRSRSAQSTKGGCGETRWSLSPSVASRSLPRIPIDPSRTVGTLTAREEGPTARSPWPGDRTRSPTFCGVGWFQVSGPADS